MAPDAEECERTAPAPVHPGRRVLPAAPPAPAHAWDEAERSGGDSRSGSPEESRRLLGPACPPPAKPHLHAPRALAVWASSASDKHTRCPHAKPAARAKTKYEKRKEKLLETLKPPYFILSMILIIVCVHVWGSEDLRAELEWSPGAWWRQPWRLLTYGWVHASGAHLALNALVALAVGWRLEREQAAWRVVAVWCGGVAAGALGAGALQPRVRVVGASAAVYALLTAHLPNVALRFGHIPLWWFRPLSVVVLVASEGCWALLRSPAPPAAWGAAHAHSPGAHAHVAWSAHVFGALVGVPLAFLVFNGENASKRHIVACRAASGAALVAGLVAACVRYACWSDELHHI